MREQNASRHVRALALFGALVTSVAAGGCNVVDGNGSVSSIRSPGGSLGNGGNGNAALGDSCSGGDGICLAVKYVVYEYENGSSVVSDAQVVENMRQINRVWAACGIAFQIDEYQKVLPRDVGLSSGSAAVNELSKIRGTLGNDNTLLVVTTHDWGTTKNAWTSMPGYSPYGAVLEASVGDYPNIIAHELGHYLNLDHYDSGANVMNTMIATNSTPLTSRQCETARAAVSDYWEAMLR